MEASFTHSVKVPTQYRKAAQLLKKAFEEGASVKGQIFAEKHARTNRLYALISKISRHKADLDALIEQSEIQKNEPRLDKYLCLVLMTELLYGAGKLNGESKPVQCIRKYEPQFRSLLSSGSAVNPIDSGNNTTISATPSFQDIAKPRYVRVNTNLISRADAIELLVKNGWIEIPTADYENNYEKFLEAVRALGDSDFMSDIHVQNLFIFPASSKRFWARNELVLESKFILQDKASCLPAVILNPPRGSIILDMCAAPGMKTTHLAAIIKNKGVIYAVEQHEKRYKTLLDFVVGTKSTSVNAQHKDALLLYHDHVPNVQYILVDPSCSGSGMVNRLFATQHDNPERLINLATLQRKMLLQAMTEYHNAQKIVYSTCSIYPEENEEVVKKCLEKCGDVWELVKPIELADKWINFGSAKYKHIGKKCLYAKPSVDLTDGFFVAMFQRKYDENGEEMWKKRALLETTNVKIEENYPNDDVEMNEEFYNEPKIEKPISKNPFYNRVKEEFPQRQGDSKNPFRKEIVEDNEPNDAKNPFTKEEPIIKTENNFDEATKNQIDLQSSQSLELTEGKSKKKKRKLNEENGDEVETKKPKKTIEDSELVNIEFKKKHKSAKREQSDAIENPVDQIKHVEKPKKTKHKSSKHENSEPTADDSQVEAIVIEKKKKSKKSKVLENHDEEVVVAKKKKSKKEKISLPDLDNLSLANEVEAAASFDVTKAKKKKKKKDKMEIVD